MIHSFKNPEFRWLSNMALVEITYKGRTFQSVEHVYMSEKFNSIDWKELCTSKTITPYNIKKLSQERINMEPFVDNWDNIKLKVMEECLSLKFNKEPFRSKLIETGNQNIQEGNYHNDLFWGVDLNTNPNLGENHLGRLIMKIREIIQNV
jgi:ribA/ribD-fused uncharacterized protein